ncbi:MAG: ribosome maturation factor RimP, partial [Pseudomonadota bacterium]|nr:ribosome maturation factor RimP [Pseudomonadota bacterium]
QNMAQQDSAIALEDAWETAAHLMAPGPAAPLLSLVAPVVQDSGLELLRIRITGQDGEQVLQIMADRDEGMITVEDCERISRSISAVLDVEDPLKGQYILEVSSPGMARPLCRPKDFIRWAGFEAKLELSCAFDGRKRFRGVLSGYEDGEVLMDVQLDGHEETPTLGFKFKDISEARLVANDEMIADALKRQKGKNGD